MKKLLALSVFGAVLMSGCSSFKAERVDDARADTEAMGITDTWVGGDTVRVIEGSMKQIYAHKGFNEYYSGMNGKRIKLFVGEIRNNTPEANLPMADIQDALLEKVSNSDQFKLIDAEKRQALLKEITYQNDGMVDPLQAKKVGKQSGADAMIFGEINMKQDTRGGKSIKYYSVNLRLTDIQSSEEICRTREEIKKYSKGNGSW